MRLYFLEVVQDYCWLITRAKRLKETNISRQNDLEFVKQIRKGDMLAFRNLVEKYKDVSFSLACSVLKDEDEAEDVLQEVFMKVLNNIKKFRFDSSFSTWLYRIVVNTCLNVKVKNKKHLYDDLSEVENLQSDYESLLDKYSKKERTAYITATFKLMRPDEALLLRLYYLCELSIAEIREVTDFTEPNIKVILYRGRKNMYRILNKLTGNELNNLI